MTENKLFPFPGVQLVKCSVIVNGAEEAADCEKERGMGRVSYWSPALSYRASFFKLNVGKTACPRNLVLGSIFLRWMCHWPNLIFFYFYCSGTLWATCYNSSSTRPLVRQPDIRDLCIPAPSTSLKKRERRSGKYWQKMCYFLLICLFLQLLLNHCCTDEHENIFISCECDIYFSNKWPNLALSGERERWRLIFLISISN